MPFSLRIYSTLYTANRRWISTKRIKPKIQFENENQEIRQTKPKSVLHRLYPWKTKQEFVEHLAANVVYNKDGLIAINKPFGIPLQKSSGLPGPNDSLFSLEEALIPLASLLQVERILPAKIMEKYSSGISLFSSKDKVLEKIQSSYGSNKSNHINTFKYLAVTIGDPKPAAGSEKVGMGFFEHKDLTRKLPIIVSNYSKKKVEAGLIKEFRVNYKTLSSGTGPCSLVEIDVSSVKGYFLRVFLSHLIAPVLGDHIFGNRVQDIMGKRLAISPLQADLLSTFQKIPQDILSRLKVADSALVPSCLHLSQLTLSNFISRGSPLVLKAEPPPSFQYICGEFGLIIPPTDEPV